MLPKEKVGGERINEEFGINGYTLLHIKYINNKVLLWYRELYSAFCNNLQWKQIRKSIYIYISSIRGYT